MAKKEDLLTSKIAYELLKLKEGDRIPTTPSLVKKYGVGFGTVDKAINNLKSLGIVELQAKGQRGTYLLKKDFKELYLLSDIGPIVGQIPLPNAIEYEALATGLTCAFKEAGLPLNLTFKNGAKSRLESLLSRRCDFIVMSGSSIECIDKQNITIIANLDKNTYYSNLYVMRNKNASHDRKDWIIGVDRNSYDNIIFTELEFKDNAKREFSYYNLPYAVANGTIDAAVIHSRTMVAAEYFNSGNIVLEPLTRVEEVHKEASHASFVALKDNTVVIELFEKVLDLKIIQKVVKQIINRRSMK